MRGWARRDCIHVRIKFNPRVTMSQLCGEKRMKNGFKAESEVRTSNRSDRPVGCTSGARRGYPFRFAFTPYPYCTAVQVMAWGGRN